MLAKKIIENLKNGNYRIECREHCDYCGFWWYVKDDELTPCDCVTTGYGDCWYDNVLIMDDLAGQIDDVTGVDCDGIIAVCDNYYGVSLQIRCKDDAIVKQIQKFFWDDTKIWCDFIASINYPDNARKTPADRRRLGRQPNLMR
jgi:hypothetical protein